MVAVPYRVVSVTAGVGQALVRHHPGRADLPDREGRHPAGLGYNEVWTEARKQALTPAQ